MKLNLRDYPCSPQESHKGPELGEWENCYQDEKQILKLAEQIRDKNKATYLKLPFDDYLEADTFGAKIDRSGTNPQVCYSIETNRSMIQEIDMELKAPTKQILEAVKLAGKEHLLLQVQAPFSILAYLTEPMVLYKRLIRDPEGVTESLHNINKSLEGYIKSAIDYGADIISLSDPCASIELLGEENYRTYSAFPMMHLLQNIEPWLNRSIVHLCPRCSSLLEQLGLIQKDTIEIEKQNQQNSLFSISHDPSVHFTGHQCIHNIYTNKIYTLTLT